MNPDHTKLGLSSRMLRTQRERMRKKKMGKYPFYSLKSFRSWLWRQKDFHRLFDQWRRMNFHTDFRPSIDRIDPTQPYRFNNIQLMTWQENNKKGNLERRKK